MTTINLTEEQMAAMILRNVLSIQEIYAACPAHMSAIDAMLAAGPQSFSQFVELMTMIVNGFRPLVLVDWLMVTCARVDLKLATGKSRDEWLALLN